MRHIHPTISQIFISGLLRFSITNLKVPINAIAKIFVFWPLKKTVKGPAKTNTCLLN